jgi:hypothetical protein
VVDDKGKIMEAEDNAQILLQHKIFKCVMCGFTIMIRMAMKRKVNLSSIQIFGNAGNMRLIGYDWETSGVV